MFPSAQQDWELDTPPKPKRSPSPERAWSDRYMDSMDGNWHLPIDILTYISSGFSFRISIPIWSQDIFCCLCARVGVKVFSLRIAVSKRGKTQQWFKYVLQLILNDIWYDMWIIESLISCLWWFKCPSELCFLTFVSRAWAISKIG